jgi:hypothetical protein
MPRVFVYDAPGYVGRNIAAAFIEAGYDVVGSVGDDPTGLPRGVAATAPVSDKEKVVELALSADVLVLSLSDRLDILSAIMLRLSLEIDRAIAEGEKIHQAGERHRPRTILGISSMLRTWANTTPRAGAKDLSPDDWSRRRPSVAFSEEHRAEMILLRANDHSVASRGGGRCVRAFALGTGLLYGNGESMEGLAPLFEQAYRAWLARFEEKRAKAVPGKASKAKGEGDASESGDEIAPLRAPLFRGRGVRNGLGSNQLPTMHVADLASTAVALAASSWATSPGGYVVCKDEGRLSAREILAALHAHFSVGGTGAVEAAPDAEVRRLQAGADRNGFRRAAALAADLPFRRAALPYLCAVRPGGDPARGSGPGAAGAVAPASGLGSVVEISWTSRYGFNAAAARRAAGRWMLRAGLAPLRVAVVGAPCAGKTTAAGRVAARFGLATFDPRAAAAALIAAAKEAVEAARAEAAEAAAAAAARGAPPAADGAPSDAADAAPPDAVAAAADAAADAAAAAVASRSPGLALGAALAADGAAADGAAGLRRRVISAQLDGASTTFAGCELSREEDQIVRFLGFVLDAPCETAEGWRGVFAREHVGARDAALGFDPLRPSCVVLLDESDDAALEARAAAAHKQQPRPGRTDPDGARARIAAWRGASASASGPLRAAVEAWDEGEGCACVLPAPAKERTDGAPLDDGAGDGAGGAPPPEDGASPEDRREAVLAECVRHAESRYLATTPPRFRRAFDPPIAVGRGESGASGEAAAGRPGDQGQGCPPDAADQGEGGAVGAAAAPDGADPPAGADARPAGHPSSAEDRSSAAGEAAERAAIEQRSRPQKQFLLDEIVPKLAQALHAAALAEPASDDVAARKDWDPVEFVAAWLERGADAPADVGAAERKVCSAE